MGVSGEKEWPEKEMTKQNQGDTNIPWGWWDDGSRGRGWSRVP